MLQTSYGMNCMNLKAPSGPPHFLPTRDRAACRALPLGFGSHRPAAKRAAHAERPCDALPLHHWQGCKGSRDGGFSQNVNHLELQLAETKSTYETHATYVHRNEHQPWERTWLQKAHPLTRGSRDAATARSPALSGRSPAALRPLSRSLALPLSRSLALSLLGVRFRLVLHEAHRDLFGQIRGLLLQHVLHISLSKSSAPTKSS